MTQGHAKEEWIRLSFLFEKQNKQKKTNLSHSCFQSFTDFFVTQF